MHRVEEAVTKFFREARVEMLMLRPEDFQSPLRQALGQLDPAGREGRG